MRNIETNKFVGKNFKKNSYERTREICSEMHHSFAGVDVSENKVEQFYNFVKRSCKSPLSPRSNVEDACTNSRRRLLTLGLSGSVSGGIGALGSLLSGLGNDVKSFLQTWRHLTSTHQQLTSAGKLSVNSTHRVDNKIQLNMENLETLFSVLHCIFITVLFSIITREK